MRDGIYSFLGVGVLFSGIILTYIVPVHSDDDIDKGPTYLATFDSASMVARLCQRCSLERTTLQILYTCEATGTRGYYHRYRFLSSKTNTCTTMTECASHAKQPACCHSIYDNPAGACAKSVRPDNLVQFTNNCFDISPYSCPLKINPNFTAGHTIECDSVSRTIDVVEFSVFCVDDKIDDYYFSSKQLYSRHLYNTEYPHSGYESFHNTTLNCTVSITGPVNYELFVMKGGNGHCAGIQLKGNDGTELYPTNRTTCNYDLTKDHFTINSSFTLKLFTNNTQATGVNAAVLVLISSKDAFTIWCHGDPIPSTTTSPPTTTSTPSPTTTTTPTTTPPPTTPPPTTTTTPPPPTTTTPPPPTTTTTPPTTTSPSTTPGATTVSSSDTAPTKEEEGGSVGVIIGAVVGVVVVAGAGVGGFFLLKMLKKPVIPSPTVSPTR